METVQTIGTIVLGLGMFGVAGALLGAKVQRKIKKGWSRWS